MSVEFHIRKYEAGDRLIVRRIFYDTAFMGEPASVFFDGEKIISDALTLYFTDYEPESCFVAEVNGSIVGCLIGAKSRIYAEKITRNKIAPALLWEVLTAGVIFKKKNFIFIFNCLVSMIKGEFNESDFNKEFPAILHINVQKGYRGFDIGSKLINTYLDYLKAQMIPGLHLATVSTDAAQFFLRQGFVLLHQGKRSYFRHILHKDIPLYIYGRKL